MKMFVAIDGEADNNGNYIVMCDSTGRTLYRPQGICSFDALNFILTVPGKPDVVCYGLNYDVNQWIKDFSRAELESLASDGHRTTYRNMYKLEWIPSKMFTVTVPGRTVVVCEVFGFFQTSFVKALQAWGIEPPAEIETMKQKRGTFTPAELDRVVSYCLQECKLLVQVMERLREACVQADCVPRRYIGAGSIASALMRRNGIKQHHAHDVDIFTKDQVNDYVLRSYFGGRVELHKQGWSQNVVSADIRSAYPAAATLLPSLTQDVEVTHVRSYLSTEKFALWRVSWRDIGNGVSPFPVRLPKGDICYPANGSGVYHAAEVKAAIDCGYDVTVHDGVILRASDAKPFDWIPDVYRLRARYKAQGSFAEKALKLGLNSVYGKTAQGYGFGRKPPYQSYFWAGFITSYTRAKVLRMLNDCGALPIMVATDGIVLDAPEPFNMVSGDNLGDWEIDTYDQIGTIQPGVYVGDSAGDTFVKSRGFFARDVDYADLIQQFYADKFGSYHYKSRRFIGLKVALHRKDFSVWRTWPNEQRSIAFEVKNKNRVENPDGTVTLLPISGPYDSLPYEPKQSLYDDPTDYTLENMVRDDQPHREVD